MAVEEKQRETAESRQSEGGAKGTAVKAAAAAAATSVAALAAKKALSHRGGSNGHARDGGSGDSDSVLSSMLSGGWDAARDVLIPAAEDAAGAVGKYLANNGPEIVRDRIVPRFIESFKQESS